MKKLALLLLILFSSYIIYRDLSIGTLSPRPETTATTAKPVQSAVPYQTVTVRPGDTLLSIAETAHNGPIPVPIEKLIADFEQLNPGEHAQTLKIGKTYKVPIYR
jgi:Tfp pilus assembly protein FimV